MKRALIALVACFSTACLRPLPPHVWMPVQHVETVDFFWWTDQRLCQARVIYWVGPHDIHSMTMTVDPSVCLERLKADGYRIPKTNPKVP